MARRIEALTEQDPRHHAAQIRGLLHETAKHCREDIDKTTERKAQALFETTAEILQDLLTAYDQYEAGARHRPRLPS